MKKIASVFIDSYHEFHNTRTLTSTAMIAAISIAIGYFTVDVGAYLKIGFSTIANQFAYLLFGPVVGACYGAAIDIIGYLIRPTGPYFPGFTIGAAAGGIIYGAILYQHAISLKRIFLAELLASIVCNMLLGTLWLSLLYGKGFFAMLPLRVFKNIVMLPINTAMVCTIGKLLESSGVFRFLKSTKEFGRG